MMKIEETDLHLKFHEMERNRRTLIIPDARRDYNEIIELYDFIDIVFQNP